MCLIVADQWTVKTKFQTLRKHTTAAVSFWFFPRPERKEAVCESTDEVVVFDSLDAMAPSRV
jgi:hypothetical protein